MESDILVEIVRKQREFIDFLCDTCKEGASFAAVHGITASYDDVKKGEEIRSEIKELEDKMGIGMFGRACSVYGDSKVCAPNPDPINFEILETKQVGFNVVARIKYPDCTNFEGIKICVYQSTNCNMIRSLKAIDPHFSNSTLSPLARFKPNGVGWEAAIDLAMILQ